MRADQAVVVFESLDSSVEGEPKLDCRCAGDRRLSHRADRSRHHEGAGAGVVDDELDLVGGQVAVDRCEVEARALGRPRHLEEAGMVLGQERDAVAGSQPGSPQQVGEAVGARLEVGVGGHAAGAHHDCRLVGTRQERAGQDY